MKGLRGTIIRLSLFGFISVVITLSVIATLLDLKIGQPAGYLQGDLHQRDGPADR